MKGYLFLYIFTCLENTMIEERNTLKIIFFVTFYFNFALSRSIINLYFQRRINLKKKTINQIYHNHCFNEQIADNFVKMAMTNHSPKFVQTTFQFRWKLETSTGSMRIGSLEFSIWQHLFKQASFLRKITLSSFVSLLFCVP